MAVAKKDDVMALWNQAYPEASTAPTNTLAKSQSDVDNMTVRDRLWDSMDFTYGQQRKASDTAYDQAFSQMGNQLLGRGMQRSSYGAQAQSNLLNKKTEAQNTIYGSQIADYEKALLDVEQQEEAKRQFNAQMGMQFLNNILANKGTPSDALLAQIGLSRADYNAMIQQLSGGGGGGGYSSGGSRSRGSGNGNGNGGGNPPPAEGDGETKLEFGELANLVGQFAGGIANKAGELVNSAKTAVGNLFNGSSSSSSTSKTNGTKYFDLLGKSKGPAGTSAR